MAVFNRLPRMPLLLLASATLMMGLYGGLYDPSFNNYLAQTHDISPLARGALEFPRELPGFLVVFIFAGLIFLTDTRIAALASVFIGVALWGQGFLAPDLAWIVFWMILWSTGAHLYMAITHPIGLRLAEAGQEGKMLGQLGFLESLGALSGMLFIYWGASRLHLSFAVIFGIAGSFALISAACLYFIKPETLSRPPRSLVFKRRYGLFYALNIVFGARKQIFLTFAPWVLIKVFGCGIQTFALLGFIGTILSLLFRPWLGRAIDAWGEKIIISGESILLIIMSILYGFSPSWFSSQVAFIIVAACFVCDQLLFAVRMARTTFLYRIIDAPEDLSPTISMGLTLDHAVAMLIPIGGGLLWTRFGYIPVFLAAGLFAVLNLWLALLIPQPGSTVDHQPASL
jgi:hypothetical protein